MDYTYNAKQENFDAANYNVSNVPIYSQALFPKYEEDGYGNLNLFTTSIFRPHESICATFFGQKQIPAVLWKVRHIIWKETTCGLSKVSFL